MSDAIVLFAHGSRDPDWAEPFERLAARVRAERPGARVALAYLEITPPTLEDAVAALVADGAREVAVVPVFLAPGGHVRRDLPLVIERLRSRHPAVRFRVLPTVGEADAVTGAIAAWIAAAAR
ncbi:MAG TPA: CbiX/SirB N-terminal domain-containing protein [Burkholderiales bacterium]|nr:CbiX/SirB N-terminal domain-containing protein [Burkholderiales bacterium]